MLGRLRGELNNWLPTITTIVVIALAIALVVFLFTKVGGKTPTWLQAVLAVTVLVLLVIVAISLFVPFDPAQQNAIDPVPIRIGVLLLGVIVVACVAGLIQVINNPPQVVEPPPTPQQAGQILTSSQGGETSEGAETTTAPVSSTVSNTANLGLSGQIVGIFGTVAAAAVGGIAGLLTQRR